MILEADDTKRQSMLKDIASQTDDAEQLLAKLKGYFADDPVNHTKAEELERIARTFFDSRDHGVIAELEKGNMESGQEVRAWRPKEKFRQIVEKSAQK